MSADLDLIALVPDLDWEHTLRTVLGRPESLATRPFTFRMLRDVMHDASVALRAADLLRPYLRHARFALVVVDLEGSGWERDGAHALSSRIETDLERSGWNDRHAVIVVEPELERWLWCDPRHLEQAIGWPVSDEHITGWLARQGLASPGSSVVLRPKEALQAVLRAARRPWSSALFSELASKASLTRCADASFRRLADVLVNWFPPI